MQNICSLPQHHESREQDKFDIEGYLNFLKTLFKKLSLYPTLTYLLCSLALKGDT